MASAKAMTKHTTNRRAFAPRLFPISITPSLHRVKGVANRLPATDARRE